MGRICEVFLVVAVLVVGCMRLDVEGQLSSTFYLNSCPNVLKVISQVVNQVVSNELRMGASLLHLHFHDCFVQGCDASHLLDDPNGELMVPPNVDSTTGFDVVDKIKASVEVVFPATISCIDILTLVAEASVVALGGPSWPISLGRRDSTTFAPSAIVTQSLIFPNETLQSITQKFSNVGLSPKDVVALSAHTIGHACCITFQSRLYNFSNTGEPDPTINPSLLSTLQALCPQDGSNLDGLTNLDQSTGNAFENLEKNYGILQSNQELYSTPRATTSASLVDLYSGRNYALFVGFKVYMVKMGNIKPLTGSSGEICLQCGQVNN